VRVLKLFRLIKIASLLQGIEILIVSEAGLLAIRFGKIMIIVLFISHWIACLLNGMTKLESQTFSPLLQSWYGL